MLKDFVERHYLEQDLNCAEAILMAGSEAYGLGITPEEMKLLSGFGAGMGCGKVCGAISGAIALLGRLQVNGRAHATPDFAKNCAAFIAACETELGALDCGELKPKFFRKECRCALTVQNVADVFEAHLEKSKIIE